MDIRILMWQEPPGTKILQLYGTSGGADAAGKSEENHVPVCRAASDELFEGKP
jgi:hypothetical protein